MAGDDQDESQKTEEPTQHRLQEALKKGQIAFSREVLHFFSLATFALIVAGLLPFIAGPVIELGRLFIESPHTYTVSPTNLGEMSQAVISRVGLAFLIPLGLFMIAAIVGGLMQTRMNVSAHPIKPSLERISLLKGFGRLFSMKSLMEFLKGIVKITVMGVVCYMAVQPYLHKFPLLTDYAPMETVRLLVSLLGRLMVGVCVAMAFIALFDFVYQRHAYMKQMRMSMQEIKEEYRQQEGDPHVKHKLKQIRMERSRKRMMSNVPKADVVITNPTHFAVALQYDAISMKAPVLIAKGADGIAAKIRELADEHKIPIVRNPPLARALYDTVDLDEEIPVEHYKAVAEVIGYVYRLQKKIMR